MERKTNWAAIAVSVVATFLLGMLWYAFLFNEQYMTGNGFSMEGEKMLKNGVEVPMNMTPMIVNVIVLVVNALIMNWLLGLAKAQNLMDGVKVGAGIGLLMLLGIITGNLFAMNPASLSMVDGSYSFLMFVVYGAILGGWQKK
ncbi:MAG: DUF1761 domain-containing protein [Saprospiraceae bacterium]|nr:DUF1761 domain-containing protein [Saprospiraceae bacterium]MCB9342970.1 DUF1761 domain-containing protein [Lewinellaceae bacterium]